MKVDEAMQAIEGQRFAALANLASNLKTFLRIASAQPEVDVLSSAMTQNKDIVLRVFARAMELSGTLPEEDCEHESDTSVSVYLWLLSKHQADLANTVAANVRSSAHFFWARKVADLLVAPPTSPAAVEIGTDIQNMRQGT